MRAVILTLVCTFGCRGVLIGPPDEEPIVVSVDAGSIPLELDAGPPPMPDAGPPPILLAPDLRVDRVDLFQSVQLPLVEDGVAADRDELPVVAGREALFRVHTAALDVWTPRAITAVLEIDGIDTLFTDTRTPLLPADESEPESLFSIRVPAEAMTVGARFRVWLEDPNGVSASFDARWPRDESFAELGAEIVEPMVLVLVPFRYETDGSGRTPSLEEDRLERIRGELTSRFPYAAIELRVHEPVSWTRSTRYNGNVDWSAVNSRLIAMRDAEDAPSDEYWYGLLMPATSRSSYCGSTYGSCVTGQAYVAGVDGSRVGSGVGFDDPASTRTLAHELGHMHGRSHAPCETSGDSSYPYYGGETGVWGWDRRDGSLWPPDSTDIMGYCDDQWISDYTYRAVYRRALALRGESIVSTRPRVARRFAFVRDGALRWGEVHALRGVPGRAGTGTWLDARGRAIGTAEIGAIEAADDPERVYVVPAASPRGAVAIAIDGVELVL